MNYLVKKAKRKDKDAFVELMELNKAGMYKVARSYLKNDDDIADAMQETVLTCFEKIGTLEQDNYFQTWLIRILINKCKDILRKKKEECLLEEFPDTADPHDFQGTLEFEELMNALDDKYRTILTLYYVEGFNTREIANILDMAENTVKTRLARGRRAYASQYKNANLKERRL